MMLLFNISRLHPLLVHLPIGILFFVALLFVLKLWGGSKKYDASIFQGLICSLGTAIFSAITGWLLSNEGGYDVDFLFWHKWLGISTTIGLALLLAFYRGINVYKANYYKTWYTGLFFVTLALLLATGHYGGSLTHGSEYLFEKPISQTTAVNTGLSIEEIPVYANLIQPILERKCVSCHKPSKKKGGLDMTEVARLMKGGRAGAIFDLEHPKNSAFLKRVLLPITEKDHMPPKGKVQLTDDEISLLEWWIENKTCVTCKVSDMENREKVNSILEKQIQPQTTLDTIELAGLNDEQISNIFANDISFGSMDATSPLVALNIQNKSEVPNSMIQAMKPIMQNISEINLSATVLNEQLMDFIADLDNLQKLQLQHTEVTDELLSKIEKLKNLESLNLYDTPISDASVDVLSTFPRLKKVYLWQSEVSEKGIDQITKAKPELEIYAGIDESIFGKATLNPPVILADTDLFEDSLRVTLKNDLKNSVIHYTLDGTEPDSTSTTYDKAITLHKSSLVKAIARKQGWGLSEKADRQFIKIEHQIVKASLSQTASPKYVSSSTTLIDLKKSSEDFRNGQWVAKEASDLTAVLELENTQTVSNVFVSALSDPGSWIFYPKGVQVAVSQDGKTFKTVNTIQIEDNNNHRDGAELSYFDVAFAPVEGKYIKVLVESILKNPAWHSSPGGGAWMFIDEILVN